MFLDVLINKFQIVHWRNHLKFPVEARLTPEAKDLICRLLCDVEHRLGTQGAQQIKVCSFANYSGMYLLLFKFLFLMLNFIEIIRVIHGSKILFGRNSMKWRQHLNQRSTGNLILRIS